MNRPEQAEWLANRHKVDRIRHAAPDLLAACIAVLVASDIGTDVKLDGDPDEAVYDGDGAEWFTVGLVAQLQAAVAKATKP